MRRLFLIPCALLGLASLGLASAGAFVSTHQANASATGTISRLSSSSITVGRHGKGHRLTCALTALSPGTGPFAVGDRVKIACASQVLVAIADVPDKTKKVSNESVATTGAIGPITALSAGSISVQTMTCTIGPGSPGTSGFAVGDSVRMYCANGVLVQFKMYCSNGALYALIHQT
jgi:hypothetical protein